MKNLVTIFAVLLGATLYTNTSFASARSELIKKQVIALSELAYGYETFKVGGKTAEEILLNYETKELGLGGRPRTGVKQLLC